MLYALIAVGSMLLAVATVPVIGAALFVLLLFGLAGLALVGVLGEVGDRTVRRDGPTLDAKGWRNGS
jgi:hypothetical protein